jgi:hypothetical protein
MKKPTPRAYAPPTNTITKKVSKPKIQIVAEKDPLRIVATLDPIWMSQIQHHPPRGSRKPRQAPERSTEGDWPKVQSGISYSPTNMMFSLTFWKFPVLRFSIGVLSGFGSFEVFYSKCVGIHCLIKV